MLVLVAFDISDNRIRRQVVKLLEGVGQRIQYSVFEAQLSESQLKQLQRNIFQRIEATDRVHYFPLCGKDIMARQADGEAIIYWPEAFTVL